jgi:hypothetical protein
LAATNAIADGIPVNITIAAGTYTESPTIVRNNTFLIGPAGVPDVVIVGTLTLNPGATTGTLVSMGASFLSVIGSVVCSDTTSVEVGWFLTNVNVTSYGVASVACTGDTVNNCSITLNNCILTQNVTANPCLLLTSCRANLVLVSMAQNTTAPCVSLVGDASIAANGATFTSAGTATASPIIFFANTIAAGSLNSFTSCNFIYTASTVGSAKTGISFANAAAANAVFNYCVFNVGGATNIITKTGIGTVAVTLGNNIAAATTTATFGAGPTYTYSPIAGSLKANSFQDTVGASGSANQVLTAGPSGLTMRWASLNVSSLGAFAATPAATAYRNSLALYDTTSQALSYDTNAYSVAIQAVPATVALATTSRGRTYILTSTGAQTVTFTTATLTANDVGFFVKLKNANANGGGDITIAGATGNLTIHNNTATVTSGTTILYWNGTALIAY